MTTRLTPEQQRAIIRWPEMDIPIFPADTKNKRISLPTWQNMDFSNTDFRFKLSNGEYDQGIAIRTGKTISGKYYAVAFDFDGWDAVVEWFDNWNHVVSLSKKTVVEWHQDQGKIHVLFLSRIEFQNRKIHIKNALMEIRCEHNALFASPSIHQGGKPYEPLGTSHLVLLDDDKVRALKSKIDTVCQNYMSDEDREVYDQWLDLPTTILGENQGRHDATKFKINRYFWKYSGEWLNLSDDQRFERAWQWHLTHCKPPRSRDEFDNICRWAITTFRVKRDELHEKIRGERQEQQQQQQAKGDEKEEEGNEGREKISTKVLKLIEPEIGLLFKDDTDTAFASINVRGHTEIIPIYKNKRFDLWIRKSYYEQNNGATLGSESLKEVVETLLSKALIDGEVKNLDLRINSDPEEPDSIYWYDLTNDKWESIRITKEGWSIVCSRKTPIIFRRRSGQLPQVYPTKDYPPDIFEQFFKLVNIKNNDANIKLLLQCYIICLIIPGIAKALLMVHGAQGAAKTAFEDLIKTLIDPSVLTNLTIPHSRAELMQQLQHNFLPYYDNLRVMPGWLSDDFCRAVTGTSNSKRELYSNDDDIIYQYMRPVGFNGIPLVANKSDLLDRGLIIELERITNENRRSWKDDIKLELERIKPQLLGFIFDIIAKVLKVKAEGGINLKSVSRMADFEIACETISRCLGNEPGKFTEAYQENKNIGVVEMIESSPVARAVIKLLESRSECSGTATELLVILEDVASMMLKINTQKEKLWPKGANILSLRLKEIKSDLEELGIFMSISQDTKTKTKTIHLEKKTSNSYEKTPPEQPEPPETQDPRSNTGNFSGGSSGDVLEQPERQPENNTKTEHDFDPSGDSGGSGDVFTEQKEDNIFRMYKMYGDTWGCQNCKITGDKWFMQEHQCKGRQQGERPK